LLAYSLCWCGCAGVLSKGRVEDWERLGRLSPEVKVDMAIEMTELAVSICAEGIRAAHPGIRDEEVLEHLRRRFAWMKRWQHQRARERGV